MFYFTFADTAFLLSTADLLAWLSERANSFSLVIVSKMIDLQDSLALT